MRDTPDGVLVSPGKQGMRQGLRGPSKVWDRDEGVAGRNERGQQCLDEASSQGKSMIFSFKKAKGKIEL